MERCRLRGSVGVAGRITAGRISRVGRPLGSILERLIGEWFTRMKRSIGSHSEQCYSGFAPSKLIFLNAIKRDTIYADNGVGRINSGEI